MISEIKCDRFWVQDNFVLLNDFRHIRLSHFRRVFYRLQISFYILKVKLRIFCEKATVSR